MRIITHLQKIYKRKTVRFPQFFELFRFCFVHFLFKSVLQPINRRYFCIFFKKPYSFLIHFHGSEKRRTGAAAALRRQSRHPVEAGLSGTFKTNLPPDSVSCTLSDGRPVKGIQNMKKLLLKSGARGRSHIISNRGLQASAAVRS